MHQLDYETLNHIDNQADAKSEWGWLDSDPQPQEEAIN